MKIKKHVKRVVPTLTDVICNRCGKSCNKDKKIEGALEFATIHATWGYFSNNRDGQEHEGHLCQNCFDLLTKKFMIPTLIRETF